jgi:hypothetical protein
LSSIYVAIGVGAGVGAGVGGVGAGVGAGHALHACGGDFDEILPYSTAIKVASHPSYCISLVSQVLAVGGVGTTMSNSVPVISLEQAVICVCLSASVPSESKTLTWHRILFSEVC